MNANMKKTKVVSSATNFIRKRKEKWRPSLNGSEDLNEDRSDSQVSTFSYLQISNYYHRNSSEYYGSSCSGPVARNCSVKKVHETFHTILRKTPAMANRFQ